MAVGEGIVLEWRVVREGTGACDGASLGLDPTQQVPMRKRPAAGCLPEDTRNRTITSHSYRLSRIYRRKTLSFVPDFAFVGGADAVVFALYSRVV